MQTLYTETNFKPPRFLFAQYRPKNQRYNSGHLFFCFSIDHQTGVIFPNASFLGKKGLQYELTIDVTDEAGQAHWDEISNARVIISIDNVNTHKPEWLPEPPPNEIIEIEEELEDADFVIMKVNARDNDVGADNSRVG